MANTTVKSEQIEDGSITADKIADGAIVATELADNAVTTAKINADAVTGAKIADDAINSEHYTDGSIDTAHIADDQVTQAKMANDSVGADELASNAVVTASIVDANVTTAKIADGNISTAKIADNAVTSAKIDTNIDIAGTFDVTGATVLDSTLAVAGDANFDSGTLFVDVSADQVGIGTTSPSAPLHVTRTASGYPILRLTQNGADQYNTIYLQNSNSTAATVVMGTGGGSVGNASWANSAVFGTTSDAKVVLLQNDSAAVTIDTDQKVGIGTASPASPLHIKTSTNHNLEFEETSGDVRISALNDARDANIRLEFAASEYEFYTGNVTVPNLYVADDIGHSGDGDTYMSFESNTLAFYAGGTHTMLVSGGTISLGTTVTNVSNFGGNAPKLFVSASGVNNRCANFYYGSTDNYEAVEFSHDRATGGNTAIIAGFRNAAGTSVGTIACTASATQFNTSSDARKKNVISEASGLNTIKKLNPVKFEWKDSGLIESGLIAQEVLEVEDTAYTVQENTDGYYVMDYSKLVTPLIKAVQEQQTIIDDLKARIEALES